jgi:hypothetical protein
MNSTFVTAFLGVASALIMALGGWVYSQSIDVSGLKKDVIFQGKNIEEQKGEVEKIAQRNVIISGDIREIKRDIRYTTETLREIKELLKKK